MEKLTKNDRLIAFSVGAFLITCALAGLASFTGEYRPEFVRGIAVVLFGPLFIAFLAAGGFLVFTAANLGRAALEAKENAE